MQRGKRKTHSEVDMWEWQMKNLEKVRFLQKQKEYF